MAAFEQGALEKTPGEAGAQIGERGGEERDGGAAGGGNARKMMEQDAVADDLDGAVNDVDAVGDCAEAAKPGRAHAPRQNVGGAQ